MSSVRWQFARQAVNMKHLRPLLARLFPLISNQPTKPFSAPMCVCVLVFFGY